MRHRRGDIVKDVNAKSLSAWEELYRSHFPALCSYAENILKRCDVAEDIVQEIFVAIWRSDRVFGSMKELTFFLYKATYNNSLHYLRTQKTHTDKLALLNENTGFDESQFAETIREELLRKLYLHIQELPPERRKIIMLSLEGHNRESIATILGISPNTVKAQKGHAIKALRNVLGDNPLLFFI
ncbi:MAG: sigma-70 family RNA polymerase sigma factor [Rikenellaceae bacterium]|nr:sigma-70 family RNA polymerase sigma factor [Rikenellaceae bacterium]MCL2692053.1 sigma-70 family RNA polymerase sigma factor [Rikenellaceae bacterium]